MLLARIDAGHVPVARTQRHCCHALCLRPQTKRCDAPHCIGVPDVHRGHGPDLAAGDDVSAAGAHMQVCNIILMHPAPLNLPRPVLLALVPTKKQLLSR